MMAFFAVEGCHCWLRIFIEQDLLEVATAGWGYLLSKTWSVTILLVNAEVVFAGRNYGGGHVLYTAAVF